MNRWWKKLVTRPIRRPIVRKAQRLGAGFGPLEDRTLMSGTASLQAGVLRIEGTTGADTINVRYLNGSYSVDGLAQTFTGSQVQSIRIDGNGGNDRINLHTEGYSTAGNTTANFVGPAQNGATIIYQPITVPTQIYGGSGNDIIDGGEGPDAIFGRAGADTIRGWAGADYIDGGLDNDNIQGGAGADTIFGDLGTDYIDGGADADKIYGGPEANTIVNSTTGDQILSNELIQGLVVDPTLRERIRYLQIDGVLSRNDMLSVFAQVESDNVVSFNEFNDLQRVEGAAAFLGMPDSVRVLTNKVINYDPANKQFAGYTLESDGKLHIGDSGSTVSLLVGKWFEGLDHPLAQNDTLDRTFDYALASGPLFSSFTETIPWPGHPGGLTYTYSTPIFTDVQQGQTSDCYFMANLAGLARSNPQTIKDMFTDNGDLTYTVKLTINGQADYVTVDKYLPVDSTGRLVMASQGRLATDVTDPLWVALAEKAYAEFNASGTIGQDGTNSYQGIAFGFGDVAYTQLTGAADTYHTFGSTGASKDDMIAALNAGKVVTYGTKVSPGNIDIVGNHLYLVTGYDATTNTFQLFNPWGVNGGSSNGHHMPGTLSLTFAELTANGNGWNGAE